MIGIRALQAVRFKAEDMKGQGAEALIIVQKETGREVIGGAGKVFLDTDGKHVVFDDCWVVDDFRGHWSAAVQDPRAPFKIEFPPAGMTEAVRGAMERIAETSRRELHALVAHQRGSDHAFLLVVERLAQQGLPRVVQESPR